MAMAVFRLDAVTHPIGVPGSTRAATSDDLDLVADWMSAFSAEALPDEPPRDERAGARRRLTDPEAVWFWLVDGVPVSLALRSVARPAEGRDGVALARIGGVYTPREHRGHGYASANVAALSQYSLDTGCAATMLFTDLTNPTSNKIYQDVGYRPVGTAATWLFSR
jgi:predicted GNAT family acetyltransferase